MSAQRRDFLKELFAAGAMPALFARPGAFGALLDPQAAQHINPDFDAQAYDFWSGFTANNGQPAIVGHGQTRGAKTVPTQPVFLHHGNEGFKNAATLDQGKLIEKGDVVVSANTSLVKVGDDDQKTFEKLQNAQLRVDVAHKISIIPPNRSHGIYRCGSNAFGAISHQAEGHHKAWFECFEEHQFANGAEHQHLIRRSVAKDAKHPIADRRRMMGAKP